MGALDDYQPRGFPSSSRAYIPQISVDGFEGSLLCFRRTLNRIRTLRLGIGKRGKAKVLVNLLDP